MLQAFHSVGATHFDLTLTTLSGEKAHFQRGVVGPRLSRRLAALLAQSDLYQQNVILRPRAEAPVTLLQLDDLNEARCRRVAAQAFLCVRTSPGSFQAWLAFGEPDREFARRLRGGLDADPSASGAVRLSGSRNFKARYAPDFPCVENVHLALGQMADRAWLERAGLLAERKPAPLRLPSRFVGGAEGRRTFPDYGRCLEGAPLNHAGTAPDRSRADFLFCLLALDAGFSVEETAARLMEVSAKAQSNGGRYAHRTAGRAWEVSR